MAIAKNISMSTAIIILVMAASVFADVPRLMNYQGQMSDTSGSPLDTTIQMIFTIYDDSTDNNIMWTETQTSVAIVNGQFSVMLGSVNSLNDDVFSAVDRFLGVTVGSDSEIDPRTRLGAVPYSIRSSTIDGALGGTIDGSVEIVTSKDRAVGLTVVGDLEVAGSATIGANLTNSGNYNIIAGQSNEISGSNSSITGGWGNTVTHHFSTISGGESNSAEWNWSTIGGGRGNSVTSQYGAISGGAYNSASQSGAVSGGTNNSAGLSAAVGGGASNTATAPYSSIAGGVNNSIEGDYSAILGGYADTITSTADYSYLFGIQSKLTEDSTFMVDMPHIRFGDEATGYEFPEEDGTSGQVMTTDGSGQLNWTTSSGGGGWVDNGTTVNLQTQTDKVAIGISSASMYPLTVADGIIVTNSSGDMKTRLHTQSDVGYVITYGANGSVNTRISYTANGAENYGSFRVCNSNGDDRVRLYANADDYGVLSLLGPTGGGNFNVVLGNYAGNPDRGRVAVYNSSGTTVALMGADNSDEGYINADLIESLTNGFKFPDGTTQLTASISGWVDDGSVVRMETSSDAVGIGTNSPSAQLEVISSSKLTSVYFESDYESNTAKVLYAKHTGNSGNDVVAVYGESVPIDYYGIGGYFKGGYVGVRARVNPTGSGTYYGIDTEVHGGSGTKYGLWSHVNGSGTCYGIRAYVQGSATNYGIYATANSGTTNWSGYFYGDVRVTGTFNNSKSLTIIDHPIDPEEKFLYHSSVSSPDMKNVYDGVIKLDNNGEAIVLLPDYFEALNGDFRYQLTCIGGYAQVYIADEISNNQFKIAGGREGMKVSWMVTGIRMDAFAVANPVSVEVNKKGEEKGKYIHPEAYGLGEELGIDYENNKNVQSDRGMK